MSNFRLFAKSRYGLAIVAELALWTSLLITIGDPQFIAAADVSLEKAIELARREAHRLGLDTMDMSFFADETNTRWRSYRPYTRDFDEFRELDAKLHNRQFFAVYGAPNPRAGGVVFGGDIFVFIDRDSGTILAVLQGR